MDKLACPVCHSPELNNGNSQLTCKKCCKQFYPGSAAIMETDDDTGIVSFRNPCKVVTFRVTASETGLDPKDN